MKNLCLNFFSWFKRALDQNLSVSKYNILAFGFVGAIGHPFYWFWWTYVDPQPEIPLLRIMGTITCLSLFTIKYWPENLKKILPLYWFFNASFNLPFIFTTYVINTKFSIIWSMAEVGMVFFLAALISNYALLAINITIGVVSAILYSLIFMPELVYFDYDLMVFVYLPVFNFSIVTGVALSYSYVKRVIELERITAQSLAGSIAHELRNPLNAINLAQSQIEQSLLNVSEAHKEVEKENKNHPTLDKRNSLLSFTSAISSSVAQANSIINMILSDLSEKPISDSDFSYLKAKDSLENIMAEYGYSSEQEKERVKLHIEEESSFTFKAIPERFTFIIYNLLKNALYYLKEYPESTITIGTDKKEVNGTPYNTIYIHDTGPGIATNAIPKLFGDFYTSGKKEGTGLGLAFCKRNMKLFGGDIICESELGKWIKDRTNPA
ncbi:MAG: multi-sensor hybrid histidine kinase [Rickettsiaceae bacterium]|nr:multi-sensor hybrid histidine kinase [Rickettsiaceae bacterium]